MMKIISAMLLVLYPLLATANDKDEKLRHLMEAQGLLAMFESQLEINKTQSEKVGKQALDQLLAELNPNEKFQKSFAVAFNSYLEKVNAPWGAEEIVRVWGQYYGKHFAENEIDSLIEFYTSPLGQKEVNASKTALTEFSVHFQKLGESIFLNATQEFIKEIKRVAQECNCQK